jgi:hypothetical protein
MPGGVSLNLVRDLGMAKAARAVGLAPPDGAGDGADTALLAAVRERLAAAYQITGCDCRACLSAPDPPFWMDGQSSWD